jgi:glycosyltransferase involved in cell wall biosynthesis
MPDLFGLSRAVRLPEPRMTQPLATIAVVPRERFSIAPQSLLSVLETISDSELVYVDAGSPPLVRQFLEQRALRHGFRLISTERYLNPNAARNVAFSHVSTKYVAFVDNDVLMSPQWLERLVACAESTGAWVVGPLVCFGQSASERIKTAGGSAEIINDRGRRVLRAQCRHHGRMVADVASELRQEPVGQVPFHAVLIRTDALKQLGGFDERLHSTAQHTDFCLRVHAQGGSVYLAPSSRVTHVPPPPFDPTDLEYFQLRWSDAWNRGSIEHFREKWNLAQDDPALFAMAERLDAHRRLTLEPYRRVLRLFGAGPARWIENLVIAPWEQAASRRRYPERGEVRRRAA